MLAKYLLILAIVGVLTPAVTQAQANTPVERLNATLLHVMQNLRRPVLVSHFDAQDCEADGATVLSIESQGRRLATLLLAPLVGWSIDLTALAPAGGRFWPIGLIGTAVSVGFLLVRSRLVAHEPTCHPNSDPQMELGPSEAA